MRAAGQIAILDSVLLGGIVEDPLRDRSDEEAMRIHSYLLLSHAALEEELEAAFEKYLSRLLGWLVADRVPIACLSLAYAASQELQISPVEYAKRDIVPQLREMSVKKYDHVVKGNHGLKSINVKSLAKPVGVPWRLIEQELGPSLADLDTLGSKRGAAGHASPFSPRFRPIEQVWWPSNVRGWVADGLAAVEAIADLLEGLVRGQEPTSLICDWDGN
jgi:hypothetical protein